MVFSKYQTTLNKDRFADQFLLTVYPGDIIYLITYRYSLSSLSKDHFIRERSIFRQGPQNSSTDQWLVTVPTAKFYQHLTCQEYTGKTAFLRKQSMHLIQQSANIIINSTEQSAVAMKGVKRASKWHRPHRTPTIATARTHTRARMHVHAHTNQ